jgi:hypothetical protein
VGAFNIIKIEHAQAKTGAKAAGSPVILQISENCVRYHGGLGPIGAAALAVDGAARSRSPATTITRPASRIRPTGGARRSPPRGSCSGAPPCARRTSPRVVLGPAEPGGDAGRYARLGEATANVEAADEGLLFLPHLLGERSPYWNPRARGAFVGLARHHGRGHLARAVMEGVAMNLYTGLAAFEEMGAAIDTVDAIGGGAASDLWLQVLAVVGGDGSGACGGESHDRLSTLRPRSERATSRTSRSPTRRSKS